MKKKIKPEHYQRLMGLNDKMAGLQTFVQTVTAEAERRNAAYAAEARQIWIDMTKDDPSLDINSIEWAPSRSEPDTIVAIQQRFFATRQD